MHKTDRFTFLLDAEDRRRLAWLARAMRRSQGDALRQILRQAAEAQPAKGERGRERPHDPTGGDAPC